MSTAILHPEQRECEIYMGSAHPLTNFTDWISSRYGESPTTLSGERIKDDYGYRPWFIGAEEVRQRIETARIENKPWSAEIIRTLQPMLDNRSVFPL